MPHARRTRTIVKHVLQIVHLARRERKVDELRRRRRVDARRELIGEPEFRGVVHRVVRLVDATSRWVEMR